MVSLSRAERYLLMSNVAVQSRGGDHVASAVVLVAGVIPELQREDLLALLLLPAQADLDSEAVSAVVSEALVAVAFEADSVVAIEEALAEEEVGLATKVAEASVEEVGMVVVAVAVAPMATVVLHLLLMLLPDRAAIEVVSVVDTVARQSTEA